VQKRITIVLITLYDKKEVRAAKRALLSGSSAIGATTTGSAFSQMSAGGLLINLINNDYVSSAIREYSKALY